MKNIEILKNEMKVKYPNEKVLSCLTCKHSVTNNENDLRCSLTKEYTTEKHICEKYSK